MNLWLVTERWRYLDQTQRDQAREILVRESVRLSRSCRAEGHRGMSNEAKPWKDPITDEDLDLWIRRPRP